MSAACSLERRGKVNDSGRGRQRSITGFCRPSTKVIHPGMGESRQSDGSAPPPLTCSSWGAGPASVASLSNEITSKPPLHPPTFKSRSITSWLFFKLVMKYLSVSSLPSSLCSKVPLKNRFCLSLSHPAKDRVTQSLAQRW